MVAEECFASVNEILLTTRKAALLRSGQYVSKKNIDQVRNIDQA
jgi:hypothetical protein